MKRNHLSCFVLCFLPSELFSEGSLDRRLWRCSLGEGLPQTQPREKLNKQKDLTPERRPGRGRGRRSPDNFLFRKRLVCFAWGTCLSITLNLSTLRWYKVKQEHRTHGCLLFAGMSLKDLEERSVSLCSVLVLRNRDITNTCGASRSRQPKVAYVRRFNQVRLTISDVAEKKKAFSSSGARRSGNAMAFARHNASRRHIATPSLSLIITSSAV